MLKPLVTSQSLVVSLQNGVRNTGVLRAQLSEKKENSPRILAAMVPFNVISGRDTFHRSTSGTLQLEPCSSSIFQTLTAAFSRAGIPFKLSPEIERVLWGKLVINLNNALNALCGLPLATQMADRRFRRIQADLMDEALGVLAKAAIRPISPLPAPLPVVSKLLRAPDWLFNRIAASQVQVDPEARLSMWFDLDRHKQTEVRYLNGEIVELARRLNIFAPMNARIIRKIEEAEQRGLGSPNLSAKDLG